MATKDNNLSLKNDKKATFDTGVIALNNQYSNLNLNQNNLPFTNEVNPSRFKSDHNEVKNVPTYASKKLTNVETDTKKMDILKVKHDDRKFGHDFENQESKQTSSKTDIKNSSTLTLHIAAYENSIEASSSGDTSERKKATSKVKNVKQVFTNVSSIQNPFEIPRMQKDGSNNTPEVQQFKAKQRLILQSQTSAAAALGILNQAAAAGVHRIYRNQANAAVAVHQNHPNQSEAAVQQDRLNQANAAAGVHQTQPNQADAGIHEDRPNQDVIVDLVSDDDSNDEDDEPPTEQQKREEKFRGMMDIAETILQQPNYDIQNFNNEFNRRCAGRIEGKKFLGSWVQHIRAVRDRFLRNGNSFANADDERFANIRRHFDPTYCVVLQIETANTNQSLQNNTDDQSRTNTNEMQNGGNVQTASSNREIEDQIYLNNSGRPARACTRPSRPTAQPSGSAAAPSNRRKQDRRSIRKRPPIGSVLNAAVSRLPLRPLIVHRPTVLRPGFHYLNNQVRPSPVLSVPSSRPPPVVSIRAPRPSQPYSFILGTRPQRGPLNPHSIVRAQLDRADDVPSPRHSPPAVPSSSASLGNNVPPVGTAQLGNVGNSANAHPPTTASATVSVASSPINFVAAVQPQPQNDGHPRATNNQPPLNGSSEVSQPQEFVVPLTPQSQQQQLNGPPTPPQQQINVPPPQQQQNQAIPIQPAQANDQQQNILTDLQQILNVFTDQNKAINGQIDFIKRLP